MFLETIVSTIFTNKPIFWSILLLIFYLVYLRIKKEGNHYTKSTRIDGKVVIITGCNKGIGKETAIDLARRGGRIYMACRNYEKCEKARLEIIESSGNKNVFNCELDLESMTSVRLFVANFLKQESRLDILINNAGVACAKKSYTKDGFEMNMGVNHMGHFLLTVLLLDILKKSAPSRIIVASSLVYWMGCIHKEDLNYDRTRRCPLFNYPHSKLANLLFTIHLSKLLQGSGVTVNSLHPGIIKTDIIQKYRVNRAFSVFSDVILYLFYKSPKSGCQTAITLAVDPDLATVSGKYFVNCRERKVFSKGRDEETADWLWYTSMEWTKLN